MCHNSFRFLDRSRPDRVDVEVLNPKESATGWYAPVTIVRTNVSERPFIVDTIREFLHSHERGIAHLVYPLMTVERDQDGRITDLLPPGERDRTESMVYAEVARVEDPEVLDAIREDTARHLEDVVKATDDFGLMVDKIGDVVSGTELSHAGPARTHGRIPRNPGLPALVAGRRIRLPGVSLLHLPSPGRGRRTCGRGRARLRARHPPGRGGGRRTPAPCR